MMSYSERYMMNSVNSVSPYTLLIQVPRKAPGSVQAPSVQIVKPLKLYNINIITTYFFFHKILMLQKVRILFNEY